MNNITDLTLGCFAELQNLPFSQKHFDKPEFQKYFQDMIQGKVILISYDKITLVNHNGEYQDFYPIPPLSGDIYCRVIDD